MVVYSQLSIWMNDTQLNVWHTWLITQCNKGTIWVVSFQTLYCHHYFVWSFTQGVIAITPCFTYVYSLVISQSEGWLYIVITNDIAVSMQSKQQLQAFVCSLLKLQINCILEIKATVRFQLQQRFSNDSQPLLHYNYCWVSAKWNILKQRF